MIWRLAAVLLFWGGVRHDGTAQTDSLEPRGSTLFEIDFASIPQPSFTWTLEGKAQPIMNEGLEEFNEGKWPRASILFNSVLRIDSSFWPARYYYAICRRGLGDIPEARKHFEKLTKDHPSIPEIWAEYGRLLQSVGEFSLAENAYTMSIQVNPNFSKGFYRLGALYAALNQESKSRKNFERCIELDPRSADAHVGLAFLKISRARKASRIDLTDINNAIAADSTYRPALYWRGLIHLQQGDLKACLKDWDRFLLYMPNNPFVLRFRSAVLMQLGQFEDAYKDLRKALVAMPEPELVDSKNIFSRPINLKRLSEYMSQKGYGLHDSAFFYLKLGFCFLSIGENGIASQAAARANAFHPSAAGYLMVGYGSVPMAYILPNYNKAIEMDRDFYEAHRLLSKHAVVSLMNYYFALKGIEEMARIEPQSKEPHQMRAFVYARQDRCREAEAEFAVYLDNNSSDTEGFRIRANCRKKLQDFRGAVEDLKRTVALDPSRESLADLFQTQIKAGDSTSAIQTLKHVNLNWPNEPELKLPLADLFVSRGDYDSAKLILGQSVELIEKTTGSHRSTLMATYYSLTGRILAGQKDYEAALKEFNKAVSSNPYELVFIYDRARLLIQMGLLKQATKDLRTLRNRGYEPAMPLWSKYLN